MKLVHVYEGVPNETYSVAGADTAAALGTAKVYKDGTVTGVKAIGALISVETFPIRYCVGGSTPTTSLGHLLNPGDVLVLKNWKAVETFKHINKVSGSNSLLQVSVEF